MKEENTINFSKNLDTLPDNGKINEDLLSQVSDKFQDRYLTHQAKKKAQLAYNDGDKKVTQFSKTKSNILNQIAVDRRSQRTFISQPIQDVFIKYLLAMASLCPSSCNRQAISIKIVKERDEKEFLSGLLVGGVGWCHRADQILLLFAHKNAYKAGNEIEFMPYLDAGVMIQQLWLSTEAIGLGCAYINPNIRENNKQIFNDRYGGDDLIFCGAMPIGYYEKKAFPTPKRKPEEVLL